MEQTNYSIDNNDTNFNNQDFNVNRVVSFVDDFCDIDATYRSNKYVDSVRLDYSEARKFQNNRPRTTQAQSKQYSFNNTQNSIENDNFQPSLEFNQALDNASISRTLDDSKQVSFVKASERDSHLTSRRSNIQHPQDPELLDLTLLLNFCNQSVIKYKLEMYVAFGEQIDNQFNDNSQKKQLDKIFRLKWVKNSILQEIVDVNQTNNFYPTPRSCAASTVVNDNLQSVGGRNDRNVFDEIWRLNLKKSNKQWSLVGKLKQPRFHCKVLNLRDKCLFIQGGHSNTSNLHYPDTIVEQDINSGTCKDKECRIFGREQFIMEKIGANKIFIGFGIYNGRALNDMQIQDYQYDAVTRIIKDNKFRAGQGMCSMVTNDRKLVVQGGTSKMKMVMNCKSLEDFKVEQDGNNDSMNGGIAFINGHQQVLNHFNSRNIKMIQLGY